RHTRFSRDWSSDVCSSDLAGAVGEQVLLLEAQLEREALGALADEQRVVRAPQHLQRDGGGIADTFETGDRPGLVGRAVHDGGVRSEERRVGQECRAVWSTD